MIAQLELKATLSLVSRDEAERVNPDDVLKHCPDFLGYPLHGHYFDCNTERLHGVHRAVDPGNAMVELTRRFVKVRRPNATSFVIDLIVNNDQLVERSVNDYCLHYYGIQASEFWIPVEDEF